MFPILLSLLLASASAISGELKGEKCAAPPIKEPQQAICWGKYHLSLALPQFQLSAMKAEAKLQKSVWSIWFVPANANVLGGGATLAIRSDNGELLELWRNQ